MVASHQRRHAAARSKYDDGLAPRKPCVALRARELERGILAPEKVAAARPWHRGCTTSDMLVRQLFDAESCTYSYLVADPAAGVAALIDPVLAQVDRELALVRDLELTLTHVLDTHVHADHATGSGRLRELTGARTCAGASGALGVDVRLADGDYIQIGSVPITAVATPGHTDDSMSYLIPGAVFTGDALRIRGCLHDSIARALFTLPDDTIVYPGYGCSAISAASLATMYSWLVWLSRITA
jgi:glyoxylase-like metal-dependent hydrolase (beta-lactamase superfamily II)